MGRTFSRYKAGWEERRKEEWEYDASKLCTVWLGYAYKQTLLEENEDGSVKDVEVELAVPKLMGRGGFQVEDSLEPWRTEPFLALLGNFQHKHVATALFPSMLEVFRTWS